MGMHKKRVSIAIFGDASLLSLGMDVQLAEDQLRIPVGPMLMGRVRYWSIYLYIYISVCFFVVLFDLI
jgi:hypothetical protein